MGCGASAGASEQKTGGSSSSQSRDEKANAKEANQEYARDLNFLGAVPLFRLLPKDQLPLVLSGCSKAEFKSNEVIIKQGDTGDEFFVIKTGEADVSVESPDGASKKVATLRSGDYFGENALLRSEPRAATVTATSGVSTLKLHRGKFYELGLPEWLHFPTRKAVGTGQATQRVEVKDPTPKTPQEERLIEDALRRNEHLQSFIMEDKVKAMVEVAWKESVPAGRDIIVEGDMSADYFYIVHSGEFEVLQTPEEAEEGQQDGRRASSLTSHLDRQSTKALTKLKDGDSFGELALLYLVPRAATVKAKVDSIVWVIDRTHFKHIMMQVSDEKLKEYIRYLDQVDLLNPLYSEEKREIANALVEMHFVEGEIVLQEGEPGNTFYILYEGQVSVTKGDAVVSTLEAGRSKGGQVQLFGERALLENEVRAATVTVSSFTAKALALDRESFDILLGPLKEITARHNESQARQSLAGKRPDGRYLTPNVARKERIHLKDLNRIGLLGCGGFGAVELYEHRATQETYALKSLSKGYIIKMGMQESVMNEKNILLMTSSKFIIRLHETYNRASTVYFLMEPAMGGELYATYNRKGFHGSEQHALFYVAGVVEGFDHLHQRHVIYRDLKPENLLLDAQGYPKITDMGLAKFVIGKTYTTCGTPDYFAPELITSTGHTNAVDWWTLGILLFELMCGSPPFESPYPMQIYSKVMKGRITWPRPVPVPVKDLVLALLVREPSERLPMKRGGIKGLREHAWFAQLSWQEFQSQAMAAPYTPRVRSKKDLANFSARKEDMPRQLDYTDPGTEWDKDFATL